MSDDKEQEDDDLLKSTDIPESADADANDTEEVETTSGEQEQEALNLDDNVKEKSPSKSEDQKLKQIKAWQSKIDSGKVSMEDLPENLGWMTGYLKPKFEVDEALLDKVISKKENERKFVSLKNDLENADLSSEMISTLNAKFKSFRDKGLSKLDALESAMEIAQVDLEQEKTKVKREKMKLPKPGAKTASQDYEKLYDTLEFREAQKVIPEQELDRIMRQRAQGSGWSPPK